MKSDVELLVIDDDDINIFIIKKTVEKTAYNANMVARSDGQKAIDYLTGLIENYLPLPNLLLVDINMPVLNGWEFLEQYEKLDIKHTIDLYMLSSSVYENDLEKARTYKSVKGFISKPLSIDRLIEIFEDISVKQE